MEAKFEKYLDHKYDEMSEHFWSCNCLYVVFAGICTFLPFFLGTSFLGNLVTSFGVLLWMFVFTMLMLEPFTFGEFLDLVVDMMIIEGQNFGKGLVFIFGNMLCVNADIAFVWLFALHSNKWAILAAILGTIGCIVPVLLVMWLKDDVKNEFNAEVVKEYYQRAKEASKKNAIEVAQSRKDNRRQRNLQLLLKQPLLTINELLRLKG